jgi:uncharacterized membrane protein YtjA (UPF0391 family)
MGNLEKDPNR